MRGIGPHDLVLHPMGLRFAGRRFPVQYGRGGIRCDKREGDGATPQAVLRITGGFFRSDRMARPASWLVPVGPRDLWSDDPGDPRYNTHIRSSCGFSHETLRRADPLYDVVLLTDWNWPEAIPGRGSAIFVHLWRGPLVPTEGCLAFHRAHLLWIVARLRPGARVVVP